MGNGLRWGVGIIGVVLVATALMRCAGERDAADAPSTDARPVAPSIAPPAIAPPASVPSESAESTRAATSTLQSYLEFLLRKQYVEADAFWDGDGPPPISGEADLRQRPAWSTMKMTLSTPVPDREHPGRLVIPVRIRGHLDGAPDVYAGDYRLREVAPGSWRITAASLRREERR